MNTSVDILAAVATYAVLTRLSSYSTGGDNDGGCFQRLARLAKYSARGGDGGIQLEQVDAAKILQFQLSAYRL